MERFRSHPLLQGWTWNSTEIITQDGGFAQGFSTNSPGRAEGWHNMPGAPVMYIVDEAKSVPDGIFTAIDRCTLKRVLYCSSPGANSGQFYRCFAEERALWSCHHATAYDCPHIPQDRIDRIISKWGADHWLTRSMIYGDFALDDSAFVITPSALSEALASPPQHVSNGFLTAFVDVAGGQDENTIAIRDGNHVYLADHWTDRNTVQSVRRAIRVLRQHNIDSSAVWVDAPGIGLAMISQFAEEGYPVNEYWGGAPASDNTRFGSLIAETWISGAIDIATGKIGLMTNDPELCRQLTTRRTEWDAKGRMRLESKEAMREHGLHSPDRADAILGAIWTGSQTSGVWTGKGTHPIVGDPLITPTSYTFTPL
jgi:hypothetical protein